MKYWKSVVSVSCGVIKKVVKKFDHLGKLKFSPVNPTAFTELGLYFKHYDIDFVSA